MTLGSPRQTPDRIKGWFTEARADHPDPHTHTQHRLTTTVIYEYGKLSPDASVDKNALTGYIYA